jgi:tryptophan synthase beta chain
MLAQAGGLPDLALACVGGGSNAIGLFTAFLEDPVELVGVEAGGLSDEPGAHAARFLGTGAGVGVLQGTRTWLLQDEAGNVLPTHSISAGLDYPAIGPEHALLRDLGRVRYACVRDAEALAAFRLLAETEGILPALESSHALAWLVREAAELRGRRVLVNLSGRGDKDLGLLA